MTVKMLVRNKIENPEKRHAIKRLADQRSNHHSRCMSPLMVFNEHILVRLIYGF